MHLLKTCVADKALDNINGLAGRKTMRVRISFHDKFQKAPAGEDG